MFYNMQARSSLVTFMVSSRELRQFSQHPFSKPAQLHGLPMPSKIKRRTFKRMRNTSQHPSITISMAYQLRVELKGELLSESEISRTT